MDESPPALDELTAILRAALPEAWRHDVAAARTPEGVVFRFRDAEGRAHALDARPRELVPEALLAGDALGFSYTLVDPAVDEAAVLDGYRAVLAALAAREADLLPWLAPTHPEAAAGPPDAEPSARGAVPRGRPAPPGLAAAVREALPEAWRRDLAVSLTPGGFLLQFTDERGARHALDAREIRPEAPTLVSGRALAFSYLFVEGGAEETALAGEYRAVLSRLAAREADLLPWLASAPTADGPPAPASLRDEASAPLPDERPAPPELVELLAGALPPPWRREVEATLSAAGGFLLRFRDEGGRRHALDARDLRFAPAPFVAGRALGYGYTLVDPAVDEAAVLDGYRAVLHGLAAREGELLPWLAPPRPGEAEGRPNAEAPPPAPNLPAPHARPAPPALVALAQGALPEPWQRAVAVSLTSGGFVLQFVDERGARRALDVRPVRPEAPTLVSGRALAFSYLPLEGGGDELALAGEYRAVLSRLAAREAELLPWIDTAPPAPEAAAPLPDERPAAPELVELLAGALPPPWRRDVSVTLSAAGGFLLRFRDEAGRGHVLDARDLRFAPAPFVAGRALGYGYTLADPAVDEAAVLDGYRAVLHALAAREGELLPWLAPPRPGEAEGRPNAEAGPASPWKGPLPQGRPAPPELVDAARAALPEAWRRDLAVSLTPGGFVLQFADERGVRHALDARGIRPEAPTLVSGRALAFSYLSLEERAEELPLASEFRAVLSRLAAREADLLPWIDDAPTTDGPPAPAALHGEASAPLPDERPAASELVELLTSALPPPWRRDVSVTLSAAGGFLLRFRDEGGRRHALDARDLRFAPAPFVAGRALGYGYTLVDPAVDEAAVLDGYRAVLHGLAAREGELLPWLAPPRPGEAEGRPNAEASPPAPNLPAPHARPAPPALVALAQGALPDAWQRAVAVSLTSGGFVLQFVDERGARRALDVRPVRPEAPTLVSGRALAFSYLPLEGGGDELALAGEYRAVLSRLAAREAELLPWIDTAPPAPEAAAPLPDERPAPRALADLLADALPPPWRRDVAVTLSAAGGFLLRFRDEAGRGHVLDARDLRFAPAPLVAGRTLGYGYTLADPAVDEAAALDGYRAVLTDLAAREGELLPWLPPVGPSGADDASWKGPFSNEQPAPPEFEALVAGLLPAAWRRDLAAMITDAGFTVRFRDEAGARRAIDARELRETEPAAATGRVLAFSYASLEEGGAPEGEALTDALRGACVALAAREADLLPWLSHALQQRALPPGPGNDTSQAGPEAVDDAPDDPASPLQEDAFAHRGPPELDALLRSLLPERWRGDVAVGMTPRGFLVRFRDESGAERAFDVREASPGERAMVQGAALAFSYLPLGGAPETVERVNEYRAVLGGLAARERDLLPWLPRREPEPAPGEAPSRDGAALPGDLGHLRQMIRGVDDATMYDGIGRIGVDAALDHVAGRVLPGAARAGGEGRGAVEFALATPGGERRLWVANDGGAVRAGVGRAPKADATARASLADFLRMLVGEPGKDVRAQLAAGTLAVEGDAAVVRALPGWFGLPG